MTDLPTFPVSYSPYDDRPEHVLRVVQPWDHGPVVLNAPNRTPEYQAYCLDYQKQDCPTCHVPPGYSCVGGVPHQGRGCAWVGPDRTNDPHTQRLWLLEDDAIHHAHAVGARCGMCEACMPDGAIRQGELRRERGEDW